MKEAQDFLEMLVSEGYSSSDIAAKLNSVGIKYSFDGNKFTIVDGEDMKTADEKPAVGQECPSILSCMSDIVENLTVNGASYRDSKFNSKVYTTCKKQIQHVCDMVGINPEQAVILSAILENRGRHNFDKHDLAGAMGLSYIKLLSFEEPIKDLAERRLINLVKNDVISISNKTVDALAANKPYSIPESKGLSTPELLKEMDGIITERENEHTEFDTMVDDLDALFANNEEAGLVKAAKTLGFDCKHTPQRDRVLFYILVWRYIYKDDDNVMWSDFDDFLEDMSEVGCYRADFNDERFQLQKSKVVEPCNEDGMAVPDSFHLTDEVKAKLFAEVGGVRNRNRRTSLKVMSPDDIPARELFYNDAEGDQIARLTQLLGQESYKATCERLRKSGMRTGFSCLFYGSPGTGKTESIYQIAKATGRKIVPVNVSEIKSCWVGESEKLIKGVFDKYRALVEESEVAPILLFNEADAIFGIRQEGAERAVDKMENSIQNIILQEMENLNGILIATTNLTQNLDKAFERRFLYKIKFNKPEIGPKTKIWMYMIPELSEQQARELAEGYSFSGGQIENISRKKVIKTILDGTEPDFAEIKGYCGEELIEGKGGESRKIGF